MGVESMKKTTVKKFKLPAEAVYSLRKKGGAHSTKKGAKGYSRKRDKSHNKANSVNELVFFLCKN